MSNKISNFVNKLKVHTGMSELYCPDCGSDQITAHGYHWIECYDCGMETYMEDGNLAMEGKGHLYKGMYSKNR